MRGLYAYQLQHWLRFFPSEQLLVLNHEQVWRFGRVEGLVYVGIWPLFLTPVSACLSFLRILYHSLCVSQRSSLTASPLAPLILPRPLHSHHSHTSAAQPGKGLRPRHRSHPSILLILRTHSYCASQRRS